MSKITFDNPWLLLFALPALTLIIIAFVVSINKENRTFKNVFSFCCHIAMTLLITFAFAKTTSETVMTETNIYVLADVSYSSNQNLDLIDKYIDDLEDNVPRNSKIGVVCFGKDHELLVELGEDLVSVKSSTVDNSETNIVDALEYTASLFEDNVIKRIVIISDGEETKQTNIVSVVQILALDDIYIDAIYLDNNLKEDSKEVQINSVEYVESTYLNYEEQVFGIIQSNNKTKAIVSLYCDGQLYKENAMVLSEGYNSFTFDLDTSTAGMHKYEVKVSSDEDQSLFNNSYQFIQNVTEKIEVLFVTDSFEDSQTASSLYNEDANITYYVRDYNVPFTLEQLCKYDEFVLSNIDIRKLNNYSQFIDSIDTLVSDFGKSLITIGNTFIQNNEDDETLSNLSDMLPVKYGNDDQSEKLVTILLDISRSMEQVDKINIEREAACLILDNLPDNVLVSVIGFCGEVGYITTPVLASNRESIKEKILTTDPKQGTFLGSALQYCYSMMSSLPYNKKEVLLISDGLPYGEQQEAARAAVKNMANDNIIVSVIHTVTQEGTVLMKQLATLGKGYYYYISKLDDVSGLVLNEVLNSLNETVLENTKMPLTIIKENDSLLQGLTNLPDISGIYNNTSKSGADVVIEATYVDANDYNHKIPLYTYWNYGNGKVTSFASNISGTWINNWESDDNAKGVLNNFLSSNQPKNRIDSAYIINVENKGTVSDVVVKAPSLSYDSILNIKVFYPNGEIEEKQLTFDSQNYVTEIDTDVVGEYKIELYTPINETASTIHYFSVSYSPEYNSFTLYEASNLYYMVSSNGQISEDGKLVLENDNSNVQKYIIDFTPILMILFIVLFICDIIVRKIRKQDLISFFGRKDKNIKEGGK